MDREENFFEKAPFYMTYPIQNLYEAEMEYEKDLGRIKQWNPKEVQFIQKMVEERCDELEYEGSRMFDEEPDHMMMQREALNIYDKISKEQNSSEQAAPVKSTSIQEISKKLYFSGVTEFQLEAASCDYRRRRDDWLCSIVEILFYHEAYRRRCRHRRCKRWW